MATAPVAYIGLGDMGGSMAARLLDRSRRVVAFDLRSEAVAEVVAKGAIAAEDAASAAAVADIVSICVPAAHHVEAVLDSIGESLRPGTTILVHSTISPHDVRTLADKVKGAAGAALFDACIAGGAEAAARGDIVMFAGGFGEMPAPARDLLDDYARAVIDAGAIGSGAAIKVAINAMTYAQIAAAAVGHGIVVGEGADPAALTEAWREMGMLGGIVERYSSIFALSVEDLAGVVDYLRTQVDNAVKDLSIAHELAGIDAPGRDWIAALSDGMASFYRYTDVQGSPS